ncbi:translation initiation factor eIF3 core subunit A [Hanseniaspora uvarum]|nr:translation initiation factor eIF3 core subunit A [Hanseniaspora uvarum]
MSAAQRNYGSRQTRHQPTFNADNVLIIADDLLNLGLHEDALDSLGEVLNQKNVKYLDPNSIAPVISRLITLSIEYKTSSVLNEGLKKLKHNYFNNPDGLKVLADLIQSYVNELSSYLEEQEKKLGEIGSQETDESSENVTPFSIMYAASKKVDASQGNAAEEENIGSYVTMVLERLHFLLNLTFNKSPLDAVYMQICYRVITIITKQKNKNQFRRFCDLMRSHMSDVLYAHKGKNEKGNYKAALSTDLNDAEVFQRLADYKYFLLRQAVKLSLWHEAYKIIEDIYTFTKINSTYRPKAIALASYYECVAKTFLAAGNHLMNAFALTKFFALYQTNPNATEEEFKKYASVNFLACLSASEFELPKSVNDPSNSLYNMMGLTEKPSRKQLLDAVLEENVYKYVSSDIKELYEALNNFNTEAIPALKKLLTTEKIQNLFKSEEYADYLIPLRDQIINKIFVAISSTQDSILISDIFDAASLPKPFDLDNFDIFNALIQAAANDFIFFNLDEESETINFVNDPYKLIYNPKAAEEEDDDDEEDIEIVDDDDAADIIDDAEEENITHDIPDLEEPQPQSIKRTSKLLKYFTEDFINSEEYSKGTYFDKVKIIREKIFAAEKRDIENELKGIEIAKGMAKEYSEKKAQQKAENEALQREIRRQQEREAKEKLKIEEAERKEEEKKKKEELAMNEQILKDAIYKMNAKGLVVVDPKDLKKHTFEEISTIDMKASLKDNQEFEEKLPTIFSRADYLYRAQLEVEEPKLKESLENFKKQQDASYEEIVAKLTEQALERHNKAVALHELLAPNYSDYASMKEALIQSRKEVFLKERQEKIDELKKKLFIEKVEALKKQEEQESRERAAIEEAERKEREQEEAKKETRERLLAAKEERRKIEEANRLEAERKFRALEEQEKAAKAVPAQAAPATGGKPILPPRAPGQSDEDREQQVNDYLKSYKFTFKEKMTIKKAEGLTALSKKK